MISYLSQCGPTSPKHATWTHPILTCAFYYIFTTTVAFLAHDYFFQSFDERVEHYFGREIPTVSSSSALDKNTKNQFGNFSFGYFVVLCSYRILQQSTDRTLQKAVFYETMWLCNMTLFMGGIGLWYGKELIIMAHLVAVSIDQVLWYVDLVGWFISGTFPVGVAKYLTWPATSFATRITSTHHLWTIPLLMYACGGIRLVAFPFSGLIICTNVLISRWITPFTIDYQYQYSLNKTKKEDTNIKDTTTTTTVNNRVKYLNVNLSHELWKDIKFEFLQIQHDNPSTALYLFRLLWRWQALNGIVFMLVLYPLSRLFFI